VLVHYTHRNKKYKCYPTPRNTLLAVPFPLRELFIIPPAFPYIPNLPPSMSATSTILLTLPIPPAIRR